MRAAFPGKIRAECSLRPYRTRQGAEASLFTAARLFVRYELYRFEVAQVGDGLSIWMIHAQATTNLNMPNLPINEELSLPIRHCHTLYRAKL